MARIIDYLMEKDTVIVFDIDGVLAPYEFGDHCHSIIDDQQWMELVSTGNPYGSIPPIKLIQRMVNAKDISKVHVCSVSCPEEYEGKRDFVLNNYNLLPENIHFVDNKMKKLNKLQELSQNLGIPEKQIAIVDDTLKILDAIARQSDFVTVHISSLFAYEE